MQLVPSATASPKIGSADKTIGGRYSVLSAFGMVPAAALGVDVERSRPGRAMVGNAARRAGRGQSGGALGIVLGLPDCTGATR